MTDNSKSRQAGRVLNRRNFVKQSAGLAAALRAQPGILTARQAGGPSPARAGQPNVILLHADQFRWDCLGAYGLNPMGLTPNLDAVAQRGTLFANVVTNQPVCCPSRACLMTGQYPAKHGVWRNGPGLAPDANTMATAFRQAGYSANYIGKWHLAGPGSVGAVPPEKRGGFLDLWRASNGLELTSHPYEGDLYDEQGQAVHFSGIYRVDFLTQLAVRFLREKPRQPFLLVVAHLEPHYQNDMNRFVGPNGYAARYANPFVPGDLRPFPGDWPSQLPDYYGCVAKIDEAAGDILKALAEEGLEDHTIFAFTSDHGCHFKTRNTEYKRSPHESSVHVPLVIQGPGFDRARVVPQLVSMVDIAPTLLDAAGVVIPSTMQGKSFLPLVEGKSSEWRNEVFIQMAEFVVGRALRTERWTYAVASTQRKDQNPVPQSELYTEYNLRNLTGGSTPVPFSERYAEYQMYDLLSDPHQLVNLAGREASLEAAMSLRERMKLRMAEAGDPVSEIDPPVFPYA